MLGAIQMLAHVHQIPTLLIKDSEDTKDTRVSAGSRRMNTVTRKTEVLVKTANHVNRSSHPTRRENEVSDPKT